MVNSRIDAKKYFLPVYVIWAIVTPTIITFMSGYRLTTATTTVFDHVPWSRVAAFYALFGLIWPLTLVVAPAFFQSVKNDTGYGLFEVFSGSGQLAQEAMFSYLMYIIAWVGPVISFVFVLYLHKTEVSKQADDPEDFTWIDYLAGFV